MQYLRFLREAQVYFDWAVVGQGMVSDVVGVAYTELMQGRWGRSIRTAVEGLIFVGVEWIVDNCLPTLLADNKSEGVAEANSFLLMDMDLYSFFCRYSSKLG